jgi:PPOX class probable F420-dependent enzyme
MNVGAPNPSGGKPGGSRGVRLGMELDTALAFAADRRDGVLTTLKRDGRPQLSNITFDALDGLFRISVCADRAKYKNLRRDPRASLYVGGPDFGSYVVLEGEAELSPVAAMPDDATVEELIDVYRRVLGEHPNWEEYRQAMITDGRLVIRLRATHAYGMVR